MELLICEFIFHTQNEIPSHCCLYLTTYILQSPHALPTKFKMAFNNIETA